MGRLETLLSTIADLSDATAVRSRITAKTKRVIAYEGLQTVAAYTKAYGDAATATLLLTVETVVAGLRATGVAENKATAVFVETYATKFINSGLALDDPDTQTSLDGMVPLIGQQLVDNLKRLGAYYVSECNTAGIDDPTLEQVEAAIETVLESRA